MKKKIPTSYGLLGMASHERQSALAKKRKPSSQEESIKLEQDICSYLRGLGGFASKIEVKGTYREQQGIYTNSRTVRGFSDIVSFYKGKPFCIEVKVKDDVQSEAQKAFQEAVEKAGAVYMVARTMEGFKHEFSKYL